MQPESWWLRVLIGIKSSFLCERINRWVVLNLMLVFVLCRLVEFYGMHSGTFMCIYFGGLPAGATLLSESWLISFQI